MKSAEQTASEALAELQTHKDAAAHATFELKVSGFLNLCMSAPSHAKSVVCS